MTCRRTGGLPHSIWSIKHIGVAVRQLRLLAAVHHRARSCPRLQLHRPPRSTRRSRRISRRSRRKSPRRSRRPPATHVNLSFGATGALYTQITQGAPFDVFFSADDKRTGTAIKDGFGVAGTEFTYAVGKVVVYSPSVDVTDGAAVLKAGAFQHIAIADPKAAPYGAAGIAVLDKLGLTAAVTAQDRDRREHHASAAVRDERQCRARLRGAEPGARQARDAGLDGAAGRLPADPAERGSADAWREQCGGQGFLGVRQDRCAR